MKNDHKLCGVGAVIGAVFCAALMTALPLWGQDSLNIRKVGEVNLWMDYAMSVYVDGNTMYVEAGDRLVVFDVTNAEAPVQMGSSFVPWNFWAGTRNMASAQGFLYTGERGNRFYVVDVRDPNQPEILDLVTFTFRSPQLGAMVAYENALYVEGQDTLFVLDITTPANPQLADTIALADAITFLKVHGASLFVGMNGIRRYDLQNPLSPILHDSLLVSTHAVFTAQGDWAYGLADSFRVFEISNPDEMVPRGSLLESSRRRKLHVISNSTVVVQGPGINAVMDVSNPTAPRRISNFEYDTDFETSGATGNRVFIPDWDRGLRSFSLTDPAHPVEVVPIGGKSPSDIIWDGRYAYVSLDDSGVVVYDMANPTVPVEVASVPMRYSGRMQKVGSYLFVNGDPFTVIYVENPVYPIATGTAGTGGNWINAAPQSDDLAVFGNKVLTSYWDELTLYEISEFGIPAERETDWSTFVDGGVRSIAAHGDIAYIEILTGRIAIVDFSDPLHPVELSSLEGDIRNEDWGDSTCRHLTADGDYLWYCGESGSLWLYDVSDPVAPLQVWHSDSLRFSRVYVAGTHLCGIKDWPHDVAYVLDISNRAAPALCGYYPLTAQGLALSGPTLVASTMSGMTILDASQALGTNDDSRLVIADFRLYPVYPNPFNGVTTVAFELPRALPVVYAVYNALGQSVERREVGMLNGGAQRILLNANGWSSGSYWVRVQAGAEVRGTKIVLMK